jgi:endo-1,4-beta-mannosidase
MAPKLQIDDRPTFLLGVNYWSRRGGPRMWARFDEDAVRAELRQMRSLGLNCCRSFCFIPDFMPRPPEVDEAPLARLRRYLDLCREEGLSTIPSLLVGHMSGENFDFPGQEGRSPYTDPEILDWQRALGSAVGGACVDHPAVIACLASNEMPLWGGTSTPEVIVAWARAIRDALGGDRPFGLGDGVMNLRGGQNGFDPLALKDVIDFIGPHTYYVDVDPLRQALNAEFCVRSVTHLGLPVLLEEFGCSATQANPANQALYYREALHACLTSGASGALSWCFSDFDLEVQPPYNHQTFELGFGVTRADGSEKPVCNELRAVAALIDEIGFADLRPPGPRAAVVVPSYFNESYPFSYDDRARMRRVLLQAYVLCAAAGLEAELVREEALELGRYRLVLAPATQKLLTATWRALLTWVQWGNTLYWSYYAGDDPFLQGAWCQLMPELTGCEHQLRYATYDLPEDPFQLHGQGLPLTVATTTGPPCRRSYLPIEPRGAQILARDGRGAPALVRNPVGQGQVLFLNHPLEYYLSELPDAGDTGVEIYRLAARTAGLEPAVRSDNGQVQLRSVEVDGARPLLWVVNHGWEPAAVSLDAPEAEPIFGADCPLLDGSQTLHLDPKQVAVYRLR